MKIDQEKERFAHSYNQITLEYLFPVKVFLNELDGSYPLPDYTVDFAPGEPLETFRRYRLNKGMSAWDVVSDYRGVMLYEKATALAAANTLVLGDELPATLTTAQPISFAATDNLRNRWDEMAGTWRPEPDYSRVIVYEKATGLPAARLDAGVPLPTDLTVIPPPAGQSVKWDDEARQWIERGPESEVGDVEIPQEELNT